MQDQNSQIPPPPPIHRMAIWEGLKIWWKRVHVQHAVIEVRTAVEEEIALLEEWRQVHEKEHLLMAEKWTEREDSEKPNNFGNLILVSREINQYLKQMWQEMAELHKLVALLNEYSQNVKVGDLEKARQIEQFLDRPLENHCEAVNLRLERLLEKLAHCRRILLDTLGRRRIVKRAYQDYVGRPTRRNATRFLLASGKEDNIWDAAFFVGWRGSCGIDAKEWADSDEPAGQASREVLALEDLDEFNKEKRRRFQLKFIEDAIHRVTRLQRRYKNAMRDLQTVRQFAA